MIRVALPQGLGRQHLQAQADMLAQAFGARRATVEGDHISSLVLRLEFVDALEQPFCLEIPMPWDGRTVTMGMTASGASWAQIARVLGVSRQAVHKKYGGTRFSRG